MNSRLEDQLRTEFEQESDFIQPRPELASRVRAAARRRRRRLTAVTAAASAVIVVAAGVSYLAALQRPSGPDASRTRSWHVITLPPGYQAQQLALAGRYLYVLAGETGAPYTLSAYDLTGKLIRRIGIPDLPAALAVGPGGFVWVSFYPDVGNSAGTWLLSPNLRLRSSYPNVAESPIVPISRTTAFSVTQDGLVTVHMPAPGKPGRPSVHLDPGTNVGAGRNTAAGVWAGSLDGRVIAQVTNGYGLDSHLVIAGQPDRRFGGGPSREVGAVASTGDSLWVELFAVKNNYAAQSGPLVRVDAQLRPTTPAAIQRSTVLARTENVWSTGDAVWVATAVRGHALVCFRSGTKPGPVITVQRGGPVAALAATRDMVYVTTTPQQSYDGSIITRHPVPTACR